QVVEQGFEAGAWRQPQWQTLETRLRQIHLLSAYAHSFRGGERAAVVYLLEHCPRRTLARLLVGESKPLWKSSMGRYLLLCPRGWLDQSAVFVARAEQAELDCLDLKQSRIDVPRENGFASRLDAEFHRPLAYDTVAAGMLVPNFSRACQTVARNQTFVDETRIACALERYRKATGAYPETLAALVPRFLDELPHEIVNGQPLQYRRTADGDYRLYSVGWDLKDDGGERGARSIVERGEKDWVWR
ncbi:MAG: hypothetical protein KGS61_13155, partial [Verrucomicrobia bacterium]|nr:hypothetical protein [Verrucomicrobiota bacterium]